MMTDPEEGDFPSLEDELLGPATADSAGAADGVRAEPRIKLPWTAPWEAAGVGRRELLPGGAGFGTFLLVDLVVMYGPLMGRDSATLPQAVILIMLAFGLGGLLARQVGGKWRPYGFGMMVGWVFLTLVSAGFLTGVMP